MVKVKDIYSFIDSFAPFSTQMEKDNSGFMLGDAEKEVTSVVTCLDIKRETIDLCKKTGANLIVSHHPLIYHPINKFDYSDPDCKLLSELIKNDIAVIAAHTCFDKCDCGNGASMALKLGADITYKYPDDPLCDVFEFNMSITFEELSKRIDDCYKDDKARKFKNNDKRIKKGIIIGGSGGRNRDFLLQIHDRYDILITSEFSYSNILLAEKLYFNIVEVGHGQSEFIFNEVMINKLKQIVKVVSSDKF